MKLLIAWVKKKLGIQSPSCFGYEYEYDYLRAKTCKGCTNAKECIMYEPKMKRCKDYKESEVQDA